MRDSFFQSVKDTPEPFRSRRVVNDDFYPMATGVSDRPLRSKILSIFSCYDSLAVDPMVLSRPVPNQEVFVVVRDRLKKYGELGEVFWAITTC